MAPPKIYLVTGAATGLGAALVSTILSSDRGDKVIATARSVAKLQHLREKHPGPDLHLSQLDVTATQTELDEKVQEAIAVFGRVDVLVNNAGFTQTGTWEDLSDSTILTTYTTLLFGPINLTRSILPHFRTNRSGHLIFTGSATAWAGYAGLGAYGSAKAALGNFVESLSQEIGGFGIKTFCIEPGVFKSEILSPEKLRVVETGIEDYRVLMQGVERFVKGMYGRQGGDTEKVARVVVDGVTGEGVFEGKEVPLRLILGSDALGFVGKKIGDEGRKLEVWRDVVVGIDGV